MLFVVLSGSICGAKRWRDYVLFDKEKLYFLREHYPFINLGLKALRKKAGWENETLSAILKQNF